MSVRSDTSVFAMVKLTAMRGRALAFLVITGIVVTWMVNYEQAAQHAYTYPRPNFLGSTWYGPLLVLLIPLTLGWMSAAAQRRGARVLGWVCSVLVFLIALLFIYIGMNAVHALPVWLQMSPQI